MMSIKWGNLAYQSPIFGREMSELQRSCAVTVALCEPCRTSNGSHAAGTPGMDAWLALSGSVRPGQGGRIFPFFFFLADGAHRGAGIGIQNLAVLSASGKYLQRDEVSA